MQTETKEKITRDRMVSLYVENRDTICINDTPKISGIRNKAIESFGQLGFPHNRLEAWRNTDLKESLEKEYDYYLRPLEEKDIQRVFRCEIPHLDTAILGQLNGWYAV